MKKKSFSFFEVLRGLIKISRWQRILLLVIGTVSCFISGMLLPLRGVMDAFFYDIYNDYIENGKPSSDASMLIMWAHGFHYCGAVAVVFSFIQIVVRELANDELVAQLKYSFFSQVLRMDLSWHDSLAKQEDLSTILSEDVERIKNTLGSKISYAIATSFSLIGAIIACLILNVNFFLLLIVSGIVIFGFTATLGRISATIAVDEQMKFRETGSIAGEVLTSLRTVKSYNSETVELARFSASVRSGKKMSTRKNIALAGLASFNSSFVFLIFGACTAVGATLILNDGLSPGYLIGAIICSFLGVFAFVCTFSIIGDITSAISSCSNLLALTELNPLIDPYTGQGSRIDDLDGDITFTDVSFSYPTRRDIKVLKRINLTIPRGQTVALVGPSGSGKSSVLSLILRFYDPDGGQISIGNQCIRDINLNDLRAKIGVVSQEPVLFDGTIEENIRYGHLKANHDEIKSAAQMANAHGFIKNLPKGYETVVGERGAMLSGGQKQRIAIARALIRQPNILILDEATSALDPHSEKVVQKTLENVSSQRTTVIVAHRLSSIKNADLIYVMKDGQITEKGNHNDLMNVRGNYFNLYSEQNAVEDSYKSEDYNCDVVPPPKDPSERRFSSDSMTIERRKSSGVFSIKSSSSSASISKSNLTKAEKTPLICQLVKMSDKCFLGVAIVSSIVLGFHMPIFVFAYHFQLLQRLAPADFTLWSIYELSIEIIYFALAVAAVTFIMYFSASLTTENVIERIRVGMFRVLLNKKMKLFDNAMSSPIRMVNGIIQNPGHLGNMASAKAGSSLGCIIYVITAIVLSMVCSWQIALVQLVFVVFTIVLNYFQVTTKYRIQESRQNQEKIASKLASMCFDNIKVVQYLSLESFMLENYKLRSTTPPRDKWKQILTLAVFYSIVTNISFFFMGVNLEYGFLWNGYSRTTMNLYFACNLMVQSSFNSINSVMLHLEDVGQSKPAVEESVNLINCDEFDEPQLVDCPTLKGGIEFKDVRFFYPTMKRHPILKGFSLDIQPGQTVALVGPSGNGKSTILSLLERFYDPSSGMITIDGIDIQSINISHLRNSMALVTQEPLLFNSTIRENILYGVKSLKKDVDEDELIRCCKQANIYNFISSLPERFDTHVGARGSRLSGGQKQRIAIARALIRNPKILLLDEATSALDAESEKEVQMALNMASKGRTTIMVAHRLTTVANADLIVVLDNGAVKEKGSHQELVDLKGKYYEMLRESNK